MNNQTFDIRGPQLIEFFNNHSHVRLATSRKYSMGERVTPTDTRRSQGKQDYLFVSSIRWQRLHSNGRRSWDSYGGYMLLNPRTNKLISATNIRSLEK